MILTVSHKDGWWAGEITDDGIVLVRSHPERRLGCAVRNLLNSLEHKFPTDLSELQLNLEEW